MNTTGRFAGLQTIIVPTPLQTVVSVVVSGLAMGIIQREALTKHFSSGETLKFSPTHQFNLNVAHVLGLYIVGQAAIIFFWAIVGLFSYLLVWWLHNLFITARNKVVVHTSYTNQQANSFDALGITIKLSSFVILIGSISLLPYGLNAWLRLWQPLLTAEFTLIGIALVLGAIVGFATELYLSFILFQFMVDRFRR